MVFLPLNDIFLVIAVAILNHDVLRVSARPVTEERYGSSTPILPTLRITRSNCVRHFRIPRRRGVTLSMFLRWALTPSILEPSLIPPPSWLIRWKK
ncbi:hypothetical protein K503DRAFT_164731 [Rhizopogon vinicolor AM-OR11-026]|uniref:Secreted protein n=1 Tax=Rhizopogon vinicolor AM-OR11-026 TaxID=1314800 RepID=A0A1B7N0N6_9AGAM|nr:hypothetical protein K503DRAFT_164731 [Rhizopogon vinicolor AM-OR11-026]